MIDGTFDASRYRWKEVTARPGSKYKIHHHYTILGYDRDAATLDMVALARRRRPLPDPPPRRHQQHHRSRR
jgi:hypothetical protein